MSWHKSCDSMLDCQLCYSIYSSFPPVTCLTGIGHSKVSGFVPRSIFSSFNILSCILLLLPVFQLPCTLLSDPFTWHITFCSLHSSHTQHLYLSYWTNSRYVHLTFTFTLLLSLCLLGLYGLFWHLSITMHTLTSPIPQPYFWWVRRQ